MCVSVFIQYGGSVLYYHVDPNKSTCFGGPFGQFLTEYFLGYDMMVISSFKGLLPSNRGKLSLLHSNTQL